MNKIEYLSFNQGEQFYQTLEAVDKLKEIATQKETSLPNLALAWLLAQEGVDAVIQGGKGKERILENIHAGEIILSKEELNIIKDILGKN